MSLRGEVQRELRVYQARTGLSTGEIAERVGYAKQSLNQFASAARYGDSGDEPAIAEALRRFFAEQPPAAPELPGQLYETDCSRSIDQMIVYAARGRWGTLYGPAGSQKSFVLEYRAAEAAREPEPRLVYLRCSRTLSPCALLRLVGKILGAPYAQYKEGIFQSVLTHIRRRKTPLALAVDEAQHLDRNFDALETVRDLGDEAHGKLGILIAGHDQAMSIFAPRRGMYLEQWRSRIEQKRVRLVGLSKAEARSIVRAELGGVKDETAEALIGEPIYDPESKRHYVSARRLFNAVRDFREKRGIQ